MSTFGGLVDEIPGISIDKFNGVNLNSKIFFLSHCHTDHMHGLSEAKDDLPGPLYLSEVSAVFVQRKFPHLNKLKTLKIGHPTIISFDSNEPIDDASTDGADIRIETSKRMLTVTSIPAGHCPGSVMFMFETADTRVLYTGDFRLDKQAIERLTAFRDNRKDVLPFDCIYIDSTFLSQRYLEFPTQRQSVDAIIELTESWLLKNSENVVVIRMPANYGYEFLLSLLAEHFAKQIHIASANVCDYSFLPELDGCYSGYVTKNTRIHFQCEAECASRQWTGRKIVCCPSLAENHIRIIRPTAMKWTDWKRNTPIVVPHEDFPETFFVCYSNHSSFTEIKQLIQFIKAKSVKFNVLPADKRLEILDAYRQIVNDDSENKAESSMSPNDSNPIITFSRIVINSGGRSQDDDDYASQPKLKRRKRAV